MSRQSSSRSDRSSRPQSSASKAACSVESKTINDENPIIRGSSAALISSARLSMRPGSSVKISKHQVVIIGAGISGLSACVKLIEEGITDIVLLEANERVGGRINTIPFRAQWIHGTEGNPIYEISSSIGNIDDSEEKNDTMVYSTQDGTTLDDNIVEQIIDKIHESLERIQDELNEDDLDKSLGGLTKNEVQKLLDQFSSDVEPELIKAIFVSEMSNQRYESACDDLNDLSAVGWNSNEDFGGEHFTKQKQGYIKIIEYLKSKIPNNVIKLNEQVEEINWSEIENETIRVRTKSGIYEANRVLTTIPVGYLKAYHQSLFKPSLPEEKASAIENLGFGCVDKIFLVFDQPLTDYDFSGIQIFYRNDLSFNLENSTKKWNLKKTDFFKELTELDKLPNHDNILIGFTAGATAIYLESLEDECVIDIYYEIISKCFPELNFPRPKSVLRSKWHSVPTIKGSYTYLRTGTSPSIIDDLARPIGKCLYFSGEGTTPSYIGTVHGGYITGREQGGLIAESLN